MPVIIGAYFLAFQRIQDKINIAHILQAMADGAFEIFKAASFQEAWGKKILHGYIKCMSETINRFSTAFFQLCFAVANIVYRGLRKIAFFREPVDAHAFFFQSVRDGHYNSSPFVLIITVNRYNVNRVCGGNDK